MLGTYKENASYFRNAYESHQYPWSNESCVLVHEFLEAIITQDHVESMLDIGCGEGANVRMAAHKGLYAVGLDRESVAIKSAKEISKKDNLEERTSFFVSDALSMPFAPHSFDVALDHGCFHHLKIADQNEYMKNVTSVLKPKGYFILEVFSRKHKGYGEVPQKGWHIVQGVYRRFFNLEDVQNLLDGEFEILTLHEKTGEIAGDWHILARMKH